MADPSFWNDQGAAREVIDEANRIKGWTEPWLQLDGRVTSLTEMLDLLEVDGDEALLQEVAADVEQIGPQRDDLQLRNMLEATEDAPYAVVIIHLGAFGTENQDW